MSKNVRKTLENKKLKKTGEVAKGENLHPSGMYIVRKIQQEISGYFMTSPKSEVNFKYLSFPKSQSYLETGSSQG